MPQGPNSSYVGSFAKPFLSMADESKDGSGDK